MTLDNVSTLPMIRPAMMLVPNKQGHSSTIPKIIERLSVHFRPVWAVPVFQAGPITNWASIYAPVPIEQTDTFERIAREAGIESRLEQILIIRPDGRCAMLTCPKLSAEAKPLPFTVPVMPVPDGDGA